MPEVVNNEEIKNNSLRDMVHITLKIAEYTKLPCLFLSSPGLGKTSMFDSWCKMNNYKLTTLIGSQRTAEEILGYMVNDSIKHMTPVKNGGYDFTEESNLTTAIPDWFREIKDNKEAGYKTALFIDELSTASEFVQGAMLQLIFSRKVGGRNNMLPEDTMIVSAANYKHNLPPQNTIMAPTLNRFVIVNLDPINSQALINEFLQSPEEMEKDLIEFGDIPITKKIEDSFRDNLRDILIKVTNTYSKDNESECINIHNQKYNDIYEREGKIYNFISGRTIHYLYRLGLGCIHLDLCKKRFQEQIDNLIFGLIGLGTNSFSTPSDLSDWLISSSQAVRKALRNTIMNSMKEEKVQVLDYSKSSVSDSIGKWLLYSESTVGSNYDENLTNLVSKITSVYDSNETSMEKVLNSLSDKKKIQAFLSDFLKIKDLISVMKQISIQQVDNLVKELEIINLTYDGYIAQVLNALK